MRQLVLRPGAIGDCILCLPALEHVAQQGETEIWISSPVAPLIQFAERVRELSSTGIDLLGISDVEPPPALVDRLRSVDRVITWYGANRPEFRKALLRLNPRSTFLDALPSADYVGHTIDFFAGQVGAPLGLVPRVQGLQTSMPGRFVAIHPFSGTARKNWPLNKFREVAGALRMPVEWTAGPDEVLREARRFETLRDLADWLATARVYLGNDSGITHLAAALNVPTVALFGPTSPALWGPRGDHVRVLRKEPLAELPVEGAVELVRSFAGS